MLQKMFMALTVLMSLFLYSCQQNSEEQREQAQPQSQAPSHIQPPEESHAVVEVHKVVAQEVIQGEKYTYLRVKEQDARYWMAIGKRAMEAGERFSFAKPLEMKNFTSKELQKTFETIYFVGRIDKETSSSAADDDDDSSCCEKSPPQPVLASQQPVTDNSKISVEPAEGGISIGELFSNRDTYANKIVRIRGQVTKVNPAIMGRNWVHLQDGTGGSENNDLVVTTQDDVTVSEVVTFEGTITLNKDFGAGYSYAVIMEEAKHGHSKN